MSRVREINFLVNRLHFAPGVLYVGVLQTREPKPQSKTSPGCCVPVDLSLGPEGGLVVLVSMWISGKSSWESK